MGNKVLRRQVVTAMQAAGVTGKLYNCKKFVAYGRSLNAKNLRLLLERFSFKPGTMINDCDGFNHRIIKPIMYRTSDGIPCIDQFECENGHRTCGCPYGPVPAWTVEQIESFHRLEQEDIDEQKKQGWWSEYDQNIQNRLVSGQRICDDDGFPLVRRS